MGGFDNSRQMRYHPCMTLNISLSPHLEEFVHQQVNAGRFSSASDMIRTALRLLEEHARNAEAAIAKVKQEIDEGLKSGPSEPATKEFWNQLRNELRG